MESIISQDQQSPVGELFSRLGEKLAARSVLVVEDDESSQEFYQQLFDIVYPDEFRCLVVSTAEAALAELEVRAFDALILDWTLPGPVDGLTLLKHLRADPGRDSLPIVMISARDGLDDETSALSAGADAYLCKPAAAEQLIVRLRGLTA